MLKVMIVDNESAIRKGLVHCIHWAVRLPHRQTTV